MTDLVVESGTGTKFKDINGKENIDCTSLTWSLITRYNHPRIIDAVKHQLEESTHSRSTFYTIPQHVLAKKLSEISLGTGAKKLKRVSFSLLGSVAKERALKLALNNKQGKLIALYHSYHVRTLGSVSVSWSHSNNKFMTLMGNTVRVTGAYLYHCSFDLNYPSCKLAYVDLLLDEAIEKAPDGPVRAMIMEPVQGKVGRLLFRKFSKEYHKKRVRQTHNKHEILLIYAGIQTGFSRVPAMLACEFYGVIPEIIIYREGRVGVNSHSRGRYHVKDCQSLHLEIMVLHLDIFLFQWWLSLRI